MICGKGSGPAAGTQNRPHSFNRHQRACALRRHRVSPVCPHASLSHGASRRPLKPAKQGEFSGQGKYTSPALTPPRQSRQHRLLESSLCRARSPVVERRERSLGTGTVWMAAQLSISAQQTTIKLNDLRTTSCCFYYHSPLFCGSEIQAG